MSKSFACAVVLFGPLALSAQVADSVAIAPGTRLRVTVDGGPPITGSLVRLTPETLDLRADAGVRQLSTATVTSLEISQGRPVTRGRVVRGALWGFAAVAVPLTGLILASDPGWAFVGPVFGIPGALVGGALAAARRPEQWARVPVSSVVAVAHSSTASVPASIIPPRKKGKGRQMAIGALLGAVAGGIYMTTDRGSTPAGTKAVLGTSAGALLGAGIGALWP